MKLRNKKTGEIVEPFGITCINGRTFVQFDDGKGIFKFEAHSLAELNEEWEDCEEPKTYWYISRFGYVVEDIDEDFGADKTRKQIGNYFETKEEAEKAVEKLKAWKRLKDNGFKFEGWERDERYCGDFTITATDQTSCDDRDLDLLFSGEDD